MTDSIKPITVNATIFFPKDMSVINTKFDDENKFYQCTLGELSDPACEKLAELDIRPKSKDLQKKHVVGKSLYKFKLFLEDGSEVPPEKVGNGTKVKALITPYRHKMSAKFGASPSIKKLIITDFVEYDPSRSTESEEAL